MAKEIEVPEAAEASDETEIIEEISETAEVAEKTEPAEEAEAGKMPEEAGEVTEAAEAPQAETTEVAEAVQAMEEETAEVVEPAEPSEPTEEIPELVEDLPQEAEIYYYGTGRRKTATAQVRLYPSKEPEIVVNDMEAGRYFSRRTDMIHLKEPLQVTATENTFRITVRVQGGGISGQAGAIRHGIARALTKANPDLRPTLRKGGFLTRDPRVKERKKPGLKRARKAPQYTKR